MNDSDKNIVILLTGTVFPNSNDILALKDPEERKSQYIEAIQFYLSKTDFDIVFVENSGTSLEKYFEGSPRIEFLTFNSPKSVPDKGKGYKELEIIDYSFKNSSLISSAKGVIKITGRLQILNISKISKSISKGSSCQENAVTCNVYQKFKMDSRGFYFTLDFFPVLKKYGKSIDFKYSFERALWRAVREYENSRMGNYYQFSEPLKIKGISGGLGITYKNGLFITLARKIKHRYMIPFVYNRFKNHSSK